MKKNKIQFIDQLGIISSGLCALHCMAIPLMISLGLMGGITGMMHDTVELMVIIFSACLGSLSIYNGLNGHGRLMPQLLIGTGALLIIIGLASNIFGHGIMGIGGIMLLYGHWQNWRQLAIQD